VEILRRRLRNLAESEEVRSEAVTRTKTKNFEAAGFDGEKVDCKSSLTIWITLEFKRKLRILAANSGEHGHSVSNYLRLLCKEKFEEQ
jgi:hypothetical protein